MYRNFICYRGSSSAGLYIADPLFVFLNAEKGRIGTTYFSPKGTGRENRNFLLDPKKYLANVENFILLLTRDFFDGFLDANGKPNPNSVTRLEIEQASKNADIKYIPVIFPDFSWNASTHGICNADILRIAFGEEVAERIIGAMPIPYVYQYQKQAFELIASELVETGYSCKIVIFDFDGTLTVPTYAENAWEKLWMALDYPVEYCEKYHRMYSNNEITHDEWCEITEKYFKERNLNRKHLVLAAEGEELLPDVKEVVKLLSSKGILLYILSGSIKQYIELVLGKETVSCFAEIKANRFLFDEQGMLAGIIGTPYDFEGKAKFVKKIIEEKGVDPQDIIYVGNSFNDEFVYTSGVKTLCINPRHTDFYNKKVWHNYLRHVKELKEILPFVEGKAQE